VIGFFVGEAETGAAVGAVVTVTSVLVGLGVTGLAVTGFIDGDLDGLAVTGDKLGFFDGDGVTGCEVGCFVTATAVVEEVVPTSVVYSLSHQLV